MAALADGMASPSERARDATGWIDLFPSAQLAGWQRTAIVPDTKLNEKNPWSVDLERKVLVCDGVGVKEMLLHQTERKDGVFHLQWRFKPVHGKADYNAGAYVRTARDGSQWVQSQIVDQIGPPAVGDLFGEDHAGGQVAKFLIQGDGKSRVKPVGEWNTHEIRCQGSRIDVWLNGAVVTTWMDCPKPTGLVGMQAEYFAIEFRELWFKPLPADAKSTSSR